MAQSAWSQKSRFQSRNTRNPKLEELLPALRKFKDGVFYKERFIGPAYSFGEHWIEIYKKSGEGTAKVRKLCLSWDHASGEFKGGCPYCDMLGDTPRVFTLQNSINRKEQKVEPRNPPKHLASEEKLVKMSDGREYFLKQPSSDSWTPVSVLKLSSSPGQHIANISAINDPDEKGESYGPEDADYGFDLQIKYDSTVSPANQYFVQKERNTELSNAEMDYLIHKLDVEPMEALSEATKEAEKFQKVLVNRPDDAGEPPAEGGGKNYLGDLNNEFNPDDEDAPRGRRRQEDDAPRSRGRRNEPEDEAPRSRSRRNEPAEDEAPRGRGRQAEPAEDEAPRRGRGREEDEAPRGRGRDDTPAPRGRRDEADDEAPRSRRRNEPAEDEAPRARNRDRDEAPRSRRNEDEAPRGRSRAADPEDEPRGRGRGRDDRDEAPAPARRRNEPEDEAPRGRSRRDEDEAPRSRSRADDRDEAPRGRSRNDDRDEPRGRRDDAPRGRRRNDDGLDM